MAENKVKFHALERLDLVDVNALQDKVYEYVAKALGNFIGNATGLLRVPDKGTATNQPNTIQVDNTNHEIDFPDFVYIEAISDGDYNDAFENRVIAFDASLSDNGACDFETFRDSVQTYYDDNGSVPDGPRSSGYESENSIYFPSIYVRKRLINAVQDNRRFWSTVSNSEFTDQVNTRQKFAVDFEVATIFPAGGWTKIGKIIAWEVDNGVVRLPFAGTSIELQYFTDALYFQSGTTIIDSSSGYSQLKQQHGGGLKMALQTIRKQISDIRGNGSQDSTLTDVTTSLFNAQPLLSLDALYKRANDIEALINDDKIGSVVFTLVSDPTNDTHTIETDFYTNTEDRVLDSGISAYFDYELLHTRTDTTTNINSWTTDDHWFLANSVLAVDFGSTYANYGIQLNASVINALALKDDAPVVHLRPLHAQPFTDSIASDATYEDILKVSSNTYQNLAETDTSFTGVKVSLTGLKELFEDIYGSAPFSTVVRIPVKIDFRLIKA